MRRITLLYEDHADPSGNVTNFGPHNLLVLCALDDLRESGAQAVDYYTARRERLVGVPKNGNSKLRAECRRLGATLARGGSPVIAVYDLDKVHHMITDVAVRQRHCKREMRELFQGESDAKDLLHVCFLDRNTETLTDIVAQILNRPQSGKPSPAERDSLLMAVAQDYDPAALEQRRELRRRVASFDYIVRRVGRLARPLLVLSET